MCGREHDHHMGRQTGSDREAVENRHRDVEKHEVESIALVRELLDLRETLHRVARLAHDLDPVRGLEHAREAFEREWLVIDQEHALHRSGTSTDTDAPVDTAPGATSLAADP